MVDTHLRLLHAGCSEHGIGSLWLAPGGLGDNHGTGSEKSSSGRKHDGKQETKETPWSYKEQKPRGPLRERREKEGINWVPDLGGRQMMSEGHPSTPQHPAASVGHVTSELGESRTSAVPADPQPGERRTVRGANL